MRVADNPFYILDVTPTDTIDTINEKYEEKAFLDEENEKVYDNARLVLTSPNKRISAEVRWFFNLLKPIDKILDEMADGKHEDPQFIIEHGDEIGDLSPREALLLNIEMLYRRPLWDARNHIVIIDYLYTDACDLGVNEIEFDYHDGFLYELFEDINRYRRKAGIPLCKDFEIVKEETKGLIKDICSALDSFISQYDDEDVIEVVNSIADDSIERRSSYGVVIEKLISSYAVRVDSLLKEYRDEIIELIDDAQYYTEEYELEELCEKVREFDHIAQPIQLLLRDQGQADLQRESVEVANRVRSLAIDYHNNDELTELSIVLLDLEMELFSELPEFYNKIQEDKKILEKLNREAAQIRFVQNKMEELDQRIVHKQGYEKTNAQYLKPRMTEYYDTINRYLNNSSSYVERGSEEYMNVYFFAALQFKSLGCHCTWSEMWEEAFNCYKIARNYAKSSGNRELLSALEDDISDVIDVLDSIAKEREEARRKNAELYYEGEWGIVFKEKVSMTPEKISYKYQEMRLADIISLSWWAVKKSVNGIPTGTDYTICVGSSNEVITLHPNESVYKMLTDKLWKAAAQKIIFNLLSNFKANRATGFSSNLTDSGIFYVEHHWFSKNENRFAKWNEIHVNYYDGNMLFYNRNNDEILSISMSSGNAHMLSAIIETALRKSLNRLSELL